MSWATRIALPIAAIGGLVYIVTWITNSTAAPKKVESPANAVRRTTAPLEFFHRTAQLDPTSDYMRYFRNNYEVGEPGKVDFWFRIASAEPVEVSLQGKNCTCSGATVATVPPEALRTFMSWVGRAMLTPESAPYAGLGIVAFQESLEFSPLPLKDKDTYPPAMLPAAVEGVPQFGIARVTWNGQKQEEVRTLVATLQTRLANFNPEAVPLEVRLLIVPPFRLFIPGSRAGELPVGDLLPFGVATMDFYTWSSTREEIEATAGLALPDPCVEVSVGIPLKGEEFAAIQSKIMRATEAPMVPRGIVKYTVTVRERTKDAQLDMGPLGQKIDIKNGDGAKQTIPLTGIVRGEVRVVGATVENDRINFGNTFRTDTGATRKVRILSDKDGLTLKLIPEEFNPSWIAAKLTVESDPEAKGAWTLEVIVPPGKLSGKLPGTAAVTLEVADGTKRRIRIPVIAVAYGESGKPNF